MAFVDRSDAGRQLAQVLARYRETHPVVLALPRGGVPVAAEIAAALEAPLDLIIVRKIGTPYQPELAMGAVVDTDPPLVVTNAEIVAAAGISDSEFATVRDRELAEARRRRAKYLGYRRQVDLRHRTVIIVDDGIATGATMRAAVEAVRKLGPDKIVVAVPVAAPSAMDTLRAEADDVVVIEAPEDLGGISSYYRDFEQVTDDEVIGALGRADVPRRS